MSSALLADLRARGLIFQIAGEDALPEWLDGGPRTLYCGFDPTADSLHIGSLVPLLMLRRFQLAGHKPLALVGGATGLIGDPSFKAEERELNTPQVVSGWVEKLKVQVSRFIDFDAGESSAEVVNNLDWTADLDVLSFLRDVGKHFSVNTMIQKESVKQRIEREGEGISFTEFTYMILQCFLALPNCFRAFPCIMVNIKSSSLKKCPEGINHILSELHFSFLFSGNAFIQNQFYNLFKLIISNVI